MQAELVEAVAPGETCAVSVVALPTGHGPRSDQHRAYELVLLLSGRQERSVEEFTVEFLPGDVFLSAPLEPHGWRTLEVGTTCLLFHFLPELLGDTEFDSIPWVSLFAAPPELRPRITTAEQRQRALLFGRDFVRQYPGTTRRGRARLPASDGRWVTVETVSTRLGHPQDLRRPGWRTAVRVCLTQLLLLLYQDWQHRDAAQTRPGPRTSDLARLQPALDLISIGSTASTPERRVSVAEAASACNLSQSHFKVVFRRTIGVPFGEFELRCRVAHAAQLLLRSDQSVEQIAAHTGFADASHFSRAFAKRYGKPPSTYRREAMAEV